jgi:hypothetical protein
MYTSTVNMQLGMLLVESVGFRQLASIAPSPKALVDTLRASVLGWVQGCEVWKIIRVFHKHLETARVVFCSEPHNSNNQHSELAIVGRIQTQLADDPPGVQSDSVNAPTLVDNDLAIKHAVAGVWNLCFTLCYVTSRTCIEKVVVVKSSLELMDLSLEMVKMVRCFQDTPLLSF